MPDKLNVTLKLSHAPAPVYLHLTAESGAVYLVLGLSYVASITADGLRLCKQVDRDIAARAGIPLDSEGRIARVGREAEGDKPDVVLEEKLRLTHELREVLQMTGAVTWEMAIDRVEQIAAENERLNTESAIPQGVRAALEARIAELEAQKKRLTEDYDRLSADFVLGNPRRMAWQEGVWEWLQRREMNLDIPLEDIAHCPMNGEGRCKLCEGRAWFIYCETFRYMREKKGIGHETH